MAIYVSSTLDHSAPSLATPSVTGRKRSITPRSPNESVLSTTLGDRDEYGRAGRVRKEKDCVSYYAWRLDHTFKFIFARESSTWQAGAYACVDCKRIDSQCEFPYGGSDFRAMGDASLGPRLDSFCGIFWRRKECHVQDQGGRVFLKFHNEALEPTQ